MVIGQNDGTSVAESSGGQLAAENLCGELMGFWSALTAVSVALEGCVMLGGPGGC